MVEAVSYLVDATNDAFDGCPEAAGAVSLDDAILCCIDGADFAADSSDAADSIAADAAYEAAAESRAADRDAADLDVYHRLRDMGIVGPAAIHLMATSEADLYTVAAEVFGDDSEDGAWNALLRTWSSVAFAGRNELLRRSRSLAPPPPLVVAPVIDVDDGADGFGPYFGGRPSSTPASTPHFCTLLLALLLPPAPPRLTFFWQPRQPKNVTGLPSHPSLLWYMGCLGMRIWSSNGKRCLGCAGAL